MRRKNEQQYFNTFFNPFILKCSRFVENLFERRMLIIFIISSKQQES